jgi:putative transposase
MFLTYKYSLRPSETQHRQLNNLLYGQRVLYNAALQERIDCYRLTGKTRTFFDQCKALTEWRRDDLDADTQPANLQRWTLKRVDDAFNGFAVVEREKQDSLASSQKPGGIPSGSTNGPASG